MCTVLLRFAPGEPWPVVFGAMRDEFADRAWDPPDRHWNGDRAHLVGGRDRTAGGTWLAVDPARPAAAALLNGRPRPPLHEGARPTRGDLALRILANGDLPDELADYDRFHLLLAELDHVELWTWDGESLEHQEIGAGPHVIVNAGLDTVADPLVPHFSPRLAALPATADLHLDAAAASWRALLQGDGLDPDDERALVVRKQIDGRPYASTSAAVVALSAAGVRYDFNPAPGQLAGWVRIPMP